MAKISVKPNFNDQIVEFEMSTAGHTDVLEKMLYHYWDNTSWYLFSFTPENEEFQFSTLQKRSGGIYGTDGEYSVVEYTITVVE